MKRKFQLTGLLCVLCLILVSCSQSEPEYVVMGGTDNGFVAASRYYCGIEGDTVIVLSGHRYDKLTLGNSSPYRRIDANTFWFDVSARSSDPATWTYEENKYDRETYDVQTLINELKQMGTLYTGDMNVIVTEFDEYTIIEVESISGMTVQDETYAVFRRGKALQIPDKFEMSSFREVQKRML